MSISGYSVSNYGRMITCEPRMTAYADALKQAIRPGARVIDLGAGPGLFAILACKMGAGQVIAIEPDASIEIARRAAQANGLAEKITFISDVSTNFAPDERVDVVVSDIRGVLPLFERHIPTICDVRARLLKPDGILIPAVDRIFAALIEAPDLRAQYHRPWLENSHNVDMSAGYNYAINSWRRTSQPASALLSEPQLFATLDYRSVKDSNHAASLSFTALRPGTAHGILMWFETELGPGIGFSNAPGEPEQVYGQGFFPLEQPVALVGGSTAEANISAHLVNSNYVWNWSFRATDTKGKVHAYRQSSFKSALLLHEALAPRAQGFRPPPSKAQEVDMACLGMFNGEVTLVEIAGQLCARFPGHFRDEAAAFEHVADLSARYNRKRIG